LARHLSQAVNDKPTGPNTRSKVRSARAYKQQVAISRQKQYRRKKTSPVNKTLETLESDPV